MTALAIVELRKAVDTRSGLARIVAVASLTAAAVAGQVMLGGSRAVTAGALLAIAQLPISVLLPVVPLLSVTTEFTRRTALTTFALVPVRGRVIAAKALATVSLSVVATAVSSTVAVLGFGAGALAGRTAGGLAVPAGVLAQLALVNLATMLCGLGFGLLVLQSAPAVVAFYAVPIGWSAAGQIVPGLATAARWLDIGQSRLPLVAAGVTGREWAAFATSCLLWVGLPIAAGAVRIHRRDL